MKKRIRVGVDVDGVLRNITPTVMELFKKHYPEAVKSDLVTGWDFPNVDLPHEKKMKVMFEEFPKEIFLLSKPFENARSEFKKLSDWADKENVELVCITTQEKELIFFTYLWLGTYKFTFSELLITGNKHERDIDYLIDDSPKNYTKWVNAKRIPENFILFDATYNQHINAPVRIKELSEAIKYV